LISYVGECLRYSGAKFDFGPFFRFFVKMVVKTIPCPEKEASSLSTISLVFLDRFL